MNKFVQKLLLMLLAVGYSTGAAGIEIQLTHQNGPQNESSYYPSGFIYSPLTSEVPDGNWKLPSTNAPVPGYAVFSLGDKKFLFLIDMKSAEDKYYNRIYFDTNCNGDLTDDKPLDASIKERSSNYFETYFQRIDTTILIDGVAKPYSFAVELYGSLPEKNDSIRERFGSSIELRIYSAYRGTFSLDGATYSVMINDANGNGRCDDSAFLTKNQQSEQYQTYNTGGDKVFISETSDHRSYDAFYYGDYLAIGNKIFRVKIDIAKDKVILDEVKKGLSPLELSCIPDRLSLVSDDNAHCVMVYKPSSTTIMIPPGSYRLMEYQLSRKDEQGDEWSLNASGTSESPVVTIEPEKKASLSFGEPFKPTIIVLKNQNDAASQRTSIRLSLLGSGLESISMLQHIKGTATKLPLSSSEGRSNYPQEASYRIIKQDGEIVAKGSFAYG